MEKITRYGREREDNKEYFVTFEVGVYVQAKDEEEAREAAELIWWQDGEVLDSTVAEVTI